MARHGHRWCRARTACGHRRFGGDRGRGCDLLCLPTHVEALHCWHLLRHRLLRRDVAHLCIREDLVRDLGDHLLGEARLLSQSVEVVHLDELNDVTRRALARRVMDRMVVRVQDHHVGEVRVAHTNNNDGHGELGGLHDRVHGLLHVVDHAVGDDQEHRVVAHLPVGGVPRQPRARADELAEEGRTREADLTERHLVRVKNTRHAVGIDLRDDRKAVGDLPPIGRLDAAAEAVDWEELIMIILLKHCEYRGDGRLILVEGHTRGVAVVQGARQGGVAVRARVVDPDHNVDLHAAAKVVDHGV
mmetsp:Transcript_106693/g.309451  ORF Transcript_106693/g.309451 Transcript_106693/m.309451 type:complete len:302 (-) Transcript_106693:1287-2192(-)